MDKVKTSPERTAGPAEPELKMITIQLEQPYTLTSGLLRAHTPSSVQKNKDWRFPRLHYVSWQEGTLALRISWDQETYHLCLAVESEQLQVGCSCRGPEEGLCLHAFKALRRLLDFRGPAFLQKYRRGGEVDLALAHKNFFYTSWQDDDLWIQETRLLGRMYQPEEARTEKGLKEALQLPVPIDPARRLQEQKESVLCYLILESPHRLMLPALIPSLGKLNKACTAVKGFENFLSGTQREYEDFLTEDQKELNRLCLQLWKAAEGMPGNLIPKDGNAAVPELAAVFQLWKQVFALLKKQPYMFRYPLYWLRELKGKPRKSNVQKIELCSEQPILGFQLLEEETYCQLQETARTYPGRPLQHFDAGLPFFIRQDNRLYLLSSLRDAAVSEWMHKMGGKMTVFRKEFPEFEYAILNELKQHYPVEQVVPKGQKSR